MIRLSRLLLACLCLPSVAAAQPADTLLAGAEPLARFAEARALALDPTGALYVVDAGRGVIVQLTPDGLPLADFGGPGAGEGEFDEPADLDPTTGLLWVVADAGNSRLQRFTRTFAHLESLPVHRADAAQPGGAARTVSIGEQAGAGQAGGRPVAVAVGPSAETFAVDAAQGVVLKWDASRRLERTIGGYDAGAGTLVDPVALAAGEDLLYVADAGQAAVVVYDLFGGYVRTLAPGRAEGVRAVTLTPEALWVVLPTRLLVYSRSGRLERAIDVRLDEPLVDVAVRGGALYLLTRTRLLRARTS
ncbi:MAG: NHL repeat-containing protein [Rhodothermales bacterium]|nr:NHL repeat-containing protein [Rhodothermales bacterium]